MEVPASRPDPTRLDGRPSLLEFVLPRLPLLMLLSIQSQAPGESPRLLLSEPLPLPEWPECLPPESAIATAALGPPR